MNRGYLKVDMLYYMVFIEIAVFLKKQIQTRPNVRELKEYYQQSSSVEGSAAFVSHMELYFYSRKPTQTIMFLAQSDHI